MAISEKAIRADLKEAMLAKDELRVRALRGLLAAIKNRAIEARGAELSEQDLVAIVKREIKQARETLEFARQGGRHETVAELEATLAVLESYLPAQLDEESLRREIEAIVEATGATTIGPVMKELAAKHAGRYDGKTASRIAAEVVGSGRR
ncbi:MAG: GatB/YqeY domain-containing protein [Candidatus Dadabacteria bacterium]|nr:MAG: GatB/YqeY domain-containing protein [Candidatus Dadabacteria bacterium]